MSWTPLEETYLADFDEALALRDRGELDGALDRLEILAAHLAAEGGRLFAHAQIQAGRIHDRRSNHVAAERHLRQAMLACPTLELASLGLFHVLLNLGRRKDALTEMVRFLAQGGKCADYEMLLAGDDFRSNLPREEFELANVARRSLSSRRSV